MTEVLIKDLDRADIERMVQEMREIDRVEFRVMSGGKPEGETLDHLLRRSTRARAGYYGGELVCVYGVLSPTLLSREGNPWLCATDLIELKEVRKAFIRNTRSELSWMAEGFSRLWNLVLDQNVTAIRWLKWIGFRFDGTGYEIDGHRFLHFAMEA